MTRLAEYLKYHEISTRIGDIDPAHKMLLYLCDRFELSMAQRFWLAWLYSMTYCGASVYYLYSEFPDAENVDIGRLQRWWDSGGRGATIFTSDRRWCRSSNQFVPAFESYRKWIGKHTQEEHFAQFAIYDTPEQRYDKLYKSATQLYSMGRFTLFNYLESLHTITNLDLCPTNLDLNDAWSPRDGLYYATGLDHYIRDEAVPIPIEAREETKVIWSDLRTKLSSSNVWNIETSLCAYRKYCRTLEGKAGANGKRWIGHYLDREGDEIAKMESRVPEGVSWRVLWEYRKETYDKAFLAEEYGHTSPDGVSKQWKEYGILRTKELLA